MECATTGWILIEAGVGINAGIAASSLSLLTFGLDSIIELISAGVLVWRLQVEFQYGWEFSEGAERLAARVGGALLFALAAYVVASAGWSLWTRHSEQFSLPGIIMTVAAIPIMALLAHRKLTIAGKIGSRALRADAMESVSCSYLAAVVAVGLLVELATGFWWVDSVTSLALVWFLVREGREAWSGEECGEHGH